MKTLKKTLCLVLAVVMVVGVLIIPANAAYDDFTDVETVKHPAAAKVLNALGIFTGYSDTTFGPGETLTRAQGATIIARAMLTPTEAAKLPAVNSFKDVTAAFGWAAGPINFCMQQGIVSGHGNGIFDPNGELTGYQLAKMLLVIMGVGEGSDYTGNGYEMQVHLDAVNCGLFKEITGVDYNKPIARENAAQMLFNAIKYNPSGVVSTTYVVWDDGVDGNGQQDAGEEVLYNDVDQFMALGFLMSKENARMRKNDIPVGSIGGRVFGLSEGTTNDEFMREIKTWVATYNTPSTADDVTVKLGLPDSKVYTNRVTIEQIGIDMGITEVGKNYTLEVWEDGVKDTDHSGTYNRREAHGVADAVLGGTGTRVEVVPVTATSFKVYVINTYVKKLVTTSPTGDIIPAVSASPTNNGAPRKIKLDSHGSTAIEYTTNDFAEGDVIIYNVGTNPNDRTKKVGVNVMKPTYITGNISRLTATGVATIGATTYVKAQHYDYNRALDNDPFATATASYVFYLDSYNNVIYVDNTTGPAAVENYLYVVDFAAIPAESTGGDHLFVPGTTTAAAAQAKVIDLKTGNLLLVNVAVSYNSVDRQYHFVNANGTPGAAITARIPAGSGAVFGLKPFKVLDDGTYAISKDETVDNVDTLTLAGGNPTLATLPSIYATSATKTTVVTLNKDANGVIVSGTVNEYTGYNDFPVAGINTANAVAKYVKRNRDGVATSVIVVLDPAKKAESYKYALYVGEAGTALINGRPTPLYQWIVDGETVYLTHGASVGTLSRNRVYTIDAVDGHISENPGTATAVISSGESVTSTDAGYFITVSGLYNMAPECVILKYTAATNTYSVLTGLTKNDSVTAYGVTTTSPSGTTRTVYLVIVTA